ncbi:MAG: hypothetical protein AB7I48_03785 [Planctomycetaceae bacterium]
MKSLSHQHSLSEVLRRPQIPMGSRSGAMISLAFWLCLLSAAALYALVVLSPKVVRWARRAEDYAVNQQRLVNLGREIQYGERLSREWEANLANGALTTPTSQAGAEQTIPVEEALRYHGPPDQLDPHEAGRTAAQGLRIPQIMARSRLLQAAGLVCSAALLAVAFTLLTEPRTHPRIRTTPLGSH